jgi:hypothetical protein
MKKVLRIPFSDRRVASIAIAKSACGMPAVFAAGVSVLFAGLLLRGFL